MNSKLITLIVRILIVVLIPTFVALLTYQWVNETFLQAKIPGSSEVKLIEIPQGKTFKEICAQLQSAGIIEHAWVLEVISRLRKSDTLVNAGEYELSPGMTPRQVLSKLIAGTVFQRHVQLIEGESIWDLGKKVEAAGLIDAETFNRALTDTTLTSAAGILAPSFEGYLFPDTYQFSKPVSPRTIIWKMLEEGEKRWSREFHEQAYKLGFSRHEILTLASIIQKEAGNEAEMPLISSVFHNRLKQGMRLQADPTVIYGIPNFNGNLTKHDLETPTPYNTYTNFGLPPGPIACPGEPAIKAALFPAEGQFIFFVADGTGKHVFSTTLKEHNEAVRKYQLGGGAPAPEGDESAN